jgi:hypothetical protein
MIEAKMKTRLNDLFNGTFNKANAELPSLKLELHLEADASVSLGDLLGAVTISIQTYTCLDAVKVTIDNGVIRD